VRNGAHPSTTREQLACTNAPAATRATHVQVSAASLARQTPRAALYIQDVLTPGTWVREVLSPWLRCRLVNQDGRHPPSAKFAGRGSSAGCAAVIERGLLDVMAYVRNGTNLPLLVELLEERGLGRGQEAVVLGCTMVVVSAAFSVYYSVKTAVLGFVALAWGIYKVGSQSMGWWD
jgi:hypothetical protein